MYCMSETSPPKPIMEVSAKVRRRLMSVNRAREPYDAVELKNQSDGDGRLLALVDRVSSKAYLDCLRQ